MKRIMIALASILVIGMLTAVSASAEPIKKRLHRQKMRIHQGVESGALTHHEYHRLMHQHRKIRHKHRRAWHDGYLSYDERCYLHERLDRASRRIHRLKHNDRWANAHYRHNRHHRSGYGSHVWFSYRGDWD